MVWETARAMATDEDANEADFSGWHFPEDPDWVRGSLEYPNGNGAFMGISFARGTSFAGATFSGHAWFDDATFSGDAVFEHATLSGDASFMDATFSSEASFMHAMFSGDARFSDATFSGDATFEGATFSDCARFCEATFSGDARFWDATFSGHAWFNDATFSGDATFAGTTFSRTAVFDHAMFSGGAWFYDATFTSYAGFSGATFSGYAQFKGAMFSGNAGFAGATFSGDADFEGAIFSGNAGFEGAMFSGNARFEGARCSPGATAYFDEARRRRGWKDMGSEGLATGIQRVVRCASFIIGRPHPFQCRREGEIAYRLAKQAAQEVGDYTMAGRYHYAEQCAIEDGYRHKSGMRPWRREFWPWLARLVFGRTVFGYGEKPLRPLAIGLAVIVICAMLYGGASAIGCGATPAEVEAYRPSLAEAAHFSIVTFTTLGHGDFEPKPGWRWLADTEAAAGAALMATFIVCLTRKYVR